jgi:TRAP-type C4-dicarboxylate transport system permease small subunit
VTPADRRDWVEVVATVLLALAAVATAWSSYQAARWNGEQAKASGAVNKTRIEAARAAGLANAQTEVDVATFTQWIDAYARREPELAKFYFKRFRKEFKPAVNAWIATRPRQNPDAPLTPFVMPEYRVAARTEAERLDRQAEELSAQVRRDIQRSTNYVLGVVLFAVALFFAAMSTKLGAPRLRVVILALGALVFLGAFVWVATSPVSFSV